MYAFPPTHYQNIPILAGTLVTVLFILRSEYRKLFYILLMTPEKEDNTFESVLFIVGLNSSSKMTLFERIYSKCYSIIN